MKNEDHQNHRILRKIVQNQVLRACSKSPIFTDHSMFMSQVCHRHATVCGCQVWFHCPKRLVFQHSQWICSECIPCGNPVASHGIPWLRFQALFLKPQMELESQVLQQTTQSDAELSWDDSIWRDRSLNYMWTTRGQTEPLSPFLSWGELHSDFTLSLSLYVTILYYICHYMSLYVIIIMSLYVIICHYMSLCMVGHAMSVIRRTSLWILPSLSSTQRMLSPSRASCLAQSTGIRFSLKNRTELKYQAEMEQL